MERIEPERARSLSSLLDRDAPAALRAFAVLQGTLAGTILVDDPANPTTAFVRESGEGTVYAGGAVTREVLEEALGEFGSQGDLLIGTRDDEPLRGLLPPDPDYSGRVLEFTERVATPLPPLPARCELRPVDGDLFDRLEWRDDTVVAFGSKERFLELGVGLCLMREGEMLAEATTGPPVDGVVELGILTREAHRGHGYATLTSAFLAAACEARGLSTYWNCNLANDASAAVARKLGYRRVREYGLVMYRGTRFVGESADT
jgi:RimJ/RimL family protein N-acetyltransferase